MKTVTKWFSRKLLVAMVAVAAIVWGIHSGDAGAEEKIISTGQIAADAAIALLAIVYQVVQGSIDKKEASSG